MLNGEELDIIRSNGGILQKGYEHELQSAASRKASAGPTRVLLAEASSDSEPETPELEARPSIPDIPTEAPLTELNLSGVYSHVCLGLSSMFCSC